MTAVTKHKKVQKLQLTDEAAYLLLSVFVDHIEQEESAAKAKRKQEEDEAIGDALRRLEVRRARESRQASRQSKGKEW
jgi:hypothetical protein